MNGSAGTASPVKDIVIAGAGECAARAALELRDRGFGGQVTVIGDEVEGPYERPPLSKSALVGSNEPAPVTVLSDETCRERDINLTLGDGVASVDRTNRAVRLTSGATVPYDRLLLATGARARALHVPGGSLAITLRTIQDARRIASRLSPGATVVVIGAGFIGLEVASSARHRKCHVIVVEQAGRALSRAVPEQAAEVLVKRHIAENVSFHFGVGIERIEAIAYGLCVRLTDGETLHADIVVAGVGAKPNDELAALSGLAIDNGVAVDAELRSSDPAVFAAGDCCSAPHRLFGGTRIRFESWRVARDQAIVAAANMLGAHVEYSAVPWFWSDQYDLTLQIAGIPSFAQREIVRDGVDGSAVHFGLDRAGRLVSASAIAEAARLTTFKVMRLAELLIAAGSTPDPIALADPTISLRTLTSNH